MMRQARLLNGRLFSYVYRLAVFGGSGLNLFASLMMLQIRQEALPFLQSLSVFIP